MTGTHICAEQGEAYRSQIFIGANDALVLRSIHHDDKQVDNSCVTEIRHCPFCGRSRDLILAEVAKTAA